jgi:hypothetical protein
MPKDMWYMNAGITTKLAITGMIALAATAMPTANADDDQLCNALGSLVGLIATGTDTWSPGGAFTAKAEVNECANSINSKAFANSLEARTGAETPIGYYDGKDSTCIGEGPNSGFFDDGAFSATYYQSGGADSDCDGGSSSGSVSGSY